MKKPFQLNQNQETAGEAFRRIADDHGYPVGEDGKIVDSGFHPGTWPDGKPKEWIGDDTVPLDPKVCAAVYMAVMDKKIQFAEKTIELLESSTEWSSDTPENIASLAFALHLAEIGDNGLFKAAAVPSGDPHREEHPEFRKLDWAVEVSGNDTILGYWEWVSHKIESEDTES